ncbi:MAG: acetate--CoA ligase [Bdellovibrionaceae bacterium]|nr:acetate--CoA ligase [Pseudobdellovibrionaceae bacterium]
MSVIKNKPQWSQSAHLDKAKYDELYRQSVSDPDAFWAKQAQRLHWDKPFTKVSDVKYTKPVHVRWFEDGELNVSYNCVDRHMENTPDRVAFYWVPEDTSEMVEQVTYKDLFHKVCKWANLLTDHGVEKGDRVTIYMPMIPDAIYCMQACARIGAIHSVVFAGFSSDALADRVNDCDSEFIITADEGYRAGKTIPLRLNVQSCLEKTPQVKKVFCVKHTGSKSVPSSDLDVDVTALLPTYKDTAAYQPMNAEDPLFILYTSGSTNKPKGVLHTSGGYLTYASYTHELVFDYKPEDIYWCAADIGWITGHSYIAYGPFANGATSVIFEGAPTYPGCDRIWKIVDDLKVSILYTAPTLIRALMKESEVSLSGTERTSLRILGSVGEPINPEAWWWYYKNAGGERAPIVDTWWQTETGGILMTPLPGVNDLKPGAAMQPFLGVQPDLVDDKGTPISGPGEGLLVMKTSWPGQMRGVYKDPDRFYETYFSQVEDRYFTGDGAKRDEDGHFWITGRVDDVLNVSGHRMGTAEIESALVAHNAVAEAAVVGFPHDVKGQGIYAYVLLMDGQEASTSLVSELQNHVRSEIGPFAKPDFIQVCKGLPKTRSGKIMRRILRKIAAQEFDNFGDTSTLAEPEVVTELVQGRTSQSH